MKIFLVLSNLGVMYFIVLNVLLNFVVVINFLFVWLLILVSKLVSNGINLFFFDFFIRIFVGFKFWWIIFLLWIYFKFLSILMKKLFILFNFLVLLLNV